MVPGIDWFGAPSKIFEVWTSIHKMGKQVPSWGESIKNVNYWYSNFSNLIWKAWKEIVSTVIHTFQVIQNTTCLIDWEQWEENCQLRRSKAFTQPPLLSHILIKRIQRSAMWSRFARRAAGQHASETVIDSFSHRAKRFMQVLAGVYVFRENVAELTIVSCCYCHYSTGIWLTKSAFIRFASTNTYRTAVPGA